MLLLLDAGLSFAGVNVVASIDSISILIGEQAHVRVDVTTDRGHRQPEFPALQARQYLTPGVEIVSVSDVTQGSTPEGADLYTCTYTLTSFDSGLYYLPPFTVKAGGRKYKSRSLALKVIDVEVDTTKVDQFYPPKDVQDNPFLWADYSEPFFLSIIAFLLFAAAYYLYTLFKGRKPVALHFSMVKRLLPHQRAMKAIERIKEEKLSGSDDQKQYYTILTDTLRTYLQERYGFNAMEMTTAEIIARLGSELDGQEVMELRSLFETADLVKFAKYSSALSENDRNLLNAIEFINQTKVDTPPAEDVETRKIKEVQRQSRKERLTLEIMISVLLAVGVGLLIYDLWIMLIR